MEELWKGMSLCSTPVALQPYHHLHSPAAAPYRGAGYHQDYLAGAVPQPPRTPPHHTALTLEFTCLGGTGAANSATSSGDDPAGCHFVFSASGGGSRRATAVQPAVAGDRRQRRMIKNRESAARSRARKQAYNNEMEAELAQLRRENRMLIQREQDLINDRLARAAQIAVPDCSSSSSSRRSTLQQKQQQQQQRCRSAPPP
ncbi:bZIP transcription factor 27-like [Hordeum vulgare subsp. vulgare]|uniref:BZIP domain-containing protein n=1 Tax=Hordeum vulgare subsp. vulgare TaxID=112509 RepID=A0A8I6XRH1_HORVV|nr:bZIP transcription factor 27-like [Hordeum vulgare subsp. vulgare]